MNNVLNVEDIGVKVRSLPSGKYRIDGKVTELPSSQRVTYQDKISKITSTRYIECYTNGKTEISLEEYNAHILTLKKVDEYGDFIGTLEEEYNYRLYKQTWQPIYNYKDTEVELEETILPVQLETGCEYIKPLFTLSDKEDSNLYSYNRIGAYKSIVEETFKEIGFEFHPVSNYAETSNRKIWGNSSHSGIRYVTAFGTYVYGDEVNSPGSRIGKLEDLLALYGTDREKLRLPILTKYNLLYKDRDEKKFDFSDLLNRVNVISNSLQRLEPKSKSYRDLLDVRGKVNGLYKLVQDFIIKESK